MYRIGIDVGGTNLKAGLVDGDGRLHKEVRKIPLVWESQEKLAADLAGLADGVAADAGISREEIASIGIGFPGPVDNRRGIVRHTVNIPIDNMPIADLLRRYWPVPVRLGNDADCAALGEFCFYEGEAIESLVLVTLGTGVGTGLIINGKIWAGHNGCGGEGGHMVLVHGGEACTCGRRGCWERYASATALIRQTKAAMKAHRDSRLWTLAEGDIERVGGRTAFEAMRGGDETGRDVVEQYIRYLADGIANLINLLQPDVVCLGGGVSHEREEDLLLPLRARVEEIVFDAGLTDSHTKIITARLGNDAGILGAALL